METLERMIPWGRDFENFFEDLGELTAFPSLGGVPRVETYQKNGTYVIKADLPGMEAKNIQVWVEGSHLIIQGERKMDQDTHKKTFRRKEILYGAFQRSILLPPGLKVEKMKAKVHKGVLEITTPMEKEVLPKEVKIEIEKSAH